MRATSRRVGASAPRCWTGSQAGSRCTSSRRRVLQDTGNRIGIVDTIAGYVHADVVVYGRGDHAGATPMNLRLDPTLVLAETAVELERLAREAGRGTVGTIGEIEVDPGLINAIASRVRFSLDIRGPDDDVYRNVAREIAAYVALTAERRGMRAEYTERQTLAATPMDDEIVSSARAGRGRDGRALSAHALGRGARHDVRRRPRPDRDGLRPLQGRDQPPPGRGRESCGRGARGRDHADGDRVAPVGPCSPSSSACSRAPASARLR